MIWILFYFHIWNVRISRTQSLLQMDFSNCSISYLAPEFKPYNRLWLITNYFFKLSPFVEAECTKKNVAPVPEYLEYWEYLLEYRSTLGVAAPDVSFSGYFILRECILESNSELFHGQKIVHEDSSQVQRGLGFAENLEISIFDQPLCMKSTLLL